MIILTQIMFFIKQIFSLLFFDLFDKIWCSLIGGKLMANIKQQKKRIKTNQKSRVFNASFKSAMKTAMKKVEKFVAEGNLEEAETSYAYACKKLDKAVSKGIVHKNFASRHKSRLSKLVNSIR